MMVHLPLCSHPNPRRILIVGGGDGGVLREVCKHESVQHITMVEIDPDVIQVAKQYFHGTAAGFRDERVHIVHADAADFLAQRDDTAADCYDVILGDTSDPVGPAESLFQPAFYENMFRALTDRGIIAVQAECFWIHLDLICDLAACCLDIGFDSAEYATTMVPTYPCGQIGFLIASRGKRTCQIPVRKPSFLKGLQWYSPEMHVAAFTLPPFVQRRLDQALSDTLNTETLEGVAVPADASRGDPFLDDGKKAGHDDEQNKCFLDGLLTFFQGLSLGNLLDDCVKDTGTDNTASVDAFDNGYMDDNDE